MTKANAVGDTISSFLDMLDRLSVNISIDPINASFVVEDGDGNKDYVLLDHFPAINIEV